MDNAMSNNRRREKSWKEKAEFPQIIVSNDLHYRKFDSSLRKIFLMENLTKMAC